MEEENGTGPWLRLLKLVVFLGIGVLLWWLPAKAVPSAMDSLRVSHCKANLRLIGSAIGEYQRENGNQFPLWLTALYPRYVPTTSTFICPMDRKLDRQIGAQPVWMKVHDTSHEDDLYHEFKTADLDGPTGDPSQDQDTIPCSYVYALSGYTEPEAPISWRERFFEMQKELGRPQGEMPIVRCYHHLPPKDPPEFDGLGDRVKKEYDASYELPTFNILFNLSFREMRYDWWKE